MLYSCILKCYFELVNNAYVQPIINWFYFQDESIILISNVFQIDKRIQPSQSIEI